MHASQRLLLAKQAAKEASRRAKPPVTSARSSNKTTSSPSASSTVAPQLEQPSVQATGTPEGVVSPAAAASAAWLQLPLHPKPLAVLVDGNACMWRLYFARNLIPEAPSIETYARLSIRNYMTQFLRFMPPSTRTLKRTIYMCWDQGDTRSRSLDLVPDYKAHRKAQEDDCRVFIEIAKEYANQRKDLFVTLPLDTQRTVEAEGDDIIFTAAEHLKQRGYPVLVVSSDKDQLQMLDQKNHVDFYHVGWKKFLSHDDVRQRFGVPSHRMWDLLSLMGDKSDNIPGSPGFGEVTAAKLVNYLEDNKMQLEDLPKDSKVADALRLKKLHRSLLDNLPRTIAIRDRMIRLRHVPEVVPVIDATVDANAHIETSIWAASKATAVNNIRQQHAFFTPSPI
jgi:DNA polymerase-1